jgi:hypothetical protein
VLARFAALKLAFNRIGDEGARSLTESSHLARFTALDLGANKLSAAGLLTAATTPRLAHLSALNLQKERPDAPRRLENGAGLAADRGRAPQPRA